MFLKGKAQVISYCGGGRDWGDVGYLEGWVALYILDVYFHLPFLHLQQMPYEEISKDTYLKMKSKVLLGGRNVVLKKENYFLEI